MADDDRYTLDDALEGVGGIRPPSPRVVDDVAIEAPDEPVDAEAFERAFFGAEIPADEAPPVPEGEFSDGRTAGDMADTVSDVNIGTVNATMGTAGNILQAVQPITGFLGEQWAKAFLWTSPEVSTEDRETIGRVVGDAVEDRYREVYGTEGVGREFSDFADYLVEQEKLGQSEELQAKRALLQADIDAASSEWEKAAIGFARTFTDPRLGASIVTQQLPQLLTGGLVARGSAKGLVAYEGATQGAEVGTGTYDQIMSENPDLLLLNDAYVGLLEESGGDEAVAKERLASSLMGRVTLSSAAITLLINRLPGFDAMERSIASGGRLTGLVGGRVKRATKLGATEGVEEFIQEGGGRGLQNTIGSIDPDQPWYEGVGEAGGQGMGPGVAMGVGIGLASGGRTNPDAPPAPTAEDTATAVGGITIDETATNEGTVDEGQGDGTRVGDERGEGGDQGNDGVDAPNDVTGDDANVGIEEDATAGGDPAVDADGEVGGTDRTEESGVEQGVEAAPEPAPISKPDRAKLMDELAPDAETREDFIAAVEKKVGAKRAALMKKNGEIRKGWQKELVRRGEAAPSDTSEQESITREEEASAEPDPTDVAPVAEPADPTVAPPIDLPETDPEPIVDETFDEATLDGDLDVEQPRQAREFVRRVSRRTKERSVTASAAVARVMDGRGDIKDLDSVELSRNQLEAILSTTFKGATAKIGPSIPTTSPRYAKRARMKTIHNRMLTRYQKQKSEFPSVEARVEIEKYGRALEVASGGRILVRSKRDVGVELGRNLSPAHGLHYGMTGRIYLNAGSHSSVEDMYTTAVHEAVHAGLSLEMGANPAAQNRLYEVTGDNLLTRADKANFTSQQEADYQNQSAVHVKVDDAMLGIFQHLQNGYGGGFNKFIRDVGLERELQGYTRGRPIKAERLTVREKALIIEEILTFSTHHAEGSGLATLRTKFARAFGNMIQSLVPGFKFRNESDQAVVEDIASVVRDARLNFEGAFDVGLFDVSREVAASGSVSTLQQYMTGTPLATAARRAEEKVDVRLQARLNGGPRISSILVGAARRTSQAVSNALEGTPVGQTIDDAKPGVQSFGRWARTKAGLSTMVGDDTIIARDILVAAENAGGHQSMAGVRHLEALVKKRYPNISAADNRTLNRAMNEFLKGDKSVQGIDLQVAAHLTEMRRDIDNLSARVNKIVAERADAEIAKLRAQLVDPDSEPDANSERVKNIERGNAKITRKIDAMVAYRDRDRTEDGSRADVLKEHSNVPQRFMNLVNMHDTIAGNMGRYVNRSFRVFEDANWVARVMRDKPVWSDAVRFAMERDARIVDEANEAKQQALDEYHAEHPNSKKPTEVDPGDLRTPKSRMQIERELRDYLEDISSKANGDVFQGLAAIGSASSAIFKNKDTSIPDPILALLGEHTDVRNNYAKSVIKLNDYIANHYFQKKLLADLEGVYIFHEDDPSPERAEANVPLIDNDDADNLLAGYRTTRMFKDGFGALQDQAVQEPMFKAWMTFVSLVKLGKTVGNPGTHVVNFASGMLHGLFHGHINPATKSGRESLAYAFDLMYRDMKGGTDALEARREMVTLMEKGILQDTNRAQETRHNIDDSYLSSPEYGTLRDKLRTPFGKVMDAYTWEDDFFKVIAYEQERKRQIRRQVPAEQAEALAAQRVRDLYWTYSKVPNWVKDVRRFPGTGTFVSWPYEMMRVTVNTATTIKRDWDNGEKAHAVARVAASTLTSAALYAAAKAINAQQGIDEDEEDAARNLVQPWNRDGTLMFVGQDDQGNPRFVNLSRYSNVGPLLDVINVLANSYGGSLENRVTRAGLVIAGPYIETDILMGATLEAIANDKFLGTKGLGGSDVRNPAESKLKQAADIAGHIGYTALPGIATAGIRIAKAGNPDTNISSSGSRMTLADELLGMVGVRRSTLSRARQAESNGHQFRRMKTLSRNILGERYQKTATVSEEDLRASFKEMTLALEQESIRMHGIIGVLRQYDFANKQIAASFKLANVSDDDIATLLDGDMVRFDLSDSFKETARERMLIDASDADKALLTTRLKERQRFVRELVREQREEDRKRPRIRIE